jgi:hypothetical protein
MNITDPIYADEDKAREHLESIQFHQSVACPCSKIVCGQLSGKSVSSR